MKNIGVVGSRDWKDENQIYEYLNKYINSSMDVCIVSGGAKGVDSFAVKYAKENKLDYKEFLPKIKKGQNRFEIIKEYYRRNKEIVDHSDVLIAFVNKDTGGTWNTIKHAKNKGIKINVIREKSET